MILKIPEDFGCEVCDATGKPLEYVVWCNTETGEAVHIVKPFETVAGEDDTLRKEWRQHPSPLTFVRGR